MMSNKPRDNIPCEKDELRAYLRRLQSYIKAKKENIKHYKRLNITPFREEIKVIKRIKLDEKKKRRWMREVVVM
jgi:hypothetical protein